MMFMKKRLNLAALAIFLGLGSVFVLAATPSPFFNGFETDTAGWFFNPPTRVASGSNGIVSAAGAWHAEAGTSATNWGGYTDTFPVGGFTTSLDIYLDMNCPVNDRRFDWTTAINTTAPEPNTAHRRDFAFNGGCYTDTDATGSGNRFVFSASNNTGRPNAFPKNPARDPIAITLSGWYTFQHRFYDNGSGLLAVDLSILDSDGGVVKTWTLSDPSDVIGVTVGGNRYGWIAQNEFPFLAIDNSELKVTPPDSDGDGVPDETDNCPGTLPGTVVGDTGCPLAVNKDACKNDGWKNLFRQDGSPFKNQGDCIQYVNTGK